PRIDRGRGIFFRGLCNVRFTPKSGHWDSGMKCPLCDKSGHYTVQQSIAPVEACTAEFYQRRALSRAQALKMSGFVYAAGCFVGLRLCIENRLRISITS